jgi:hypothetical protein
MPDQRVLKGIYKEGPTVASAIIIDEKFARLMVKGAEPVMPADPNWPGALKRIVEACRPHLEKIENRELVVVFDQRPALMDQCVVPPDDVKVMGLQAVSCMDAACGLVAAKSYDEPPPTPLAYTSLKASPYGTVQPGRVDIPARCPRKTFRDLPQPAQQALGVAVQLAGAGIMRVVSFEDEGLKVASALRDFPPPRARSVLYDLGAMAAMVAEGKPLHEVGQAMANARG